MSAHSPRIVMLASVLTALLALGPVGASVSRAADLTESLPPESTVLGAIDLKALRDGHLVDVNSWRSVSSDGAAHARALLDQAGIDVQRDVDSIAMAAFPGRGKSGAEEDSEFVLLASGRFDQDRVRKTALANGGLAMTLPATGGSPARQAIRLPGESGRPVVLTFVDAGVLAIGSPAGASRVRAKASSAIPLLARARERIPSKAPFWVFADARSTPGRAEAAASLPALSALQTVAFWGLATDVLDLQAVAETADAESASKLAAWLQLGMGFLASSGGGSATSPDAAALKALGGLKLAANGARLTARLTLTKAQLDALRAN